MNSTQNIQSNDISFLLLEIKVIIYMIMHFYLFFCSFKSIFKCTSMKLLSIIWVLITSKLHMNKLYYFTSILYTQ